MRLGYHYHVPVLLKEGKVYIHSYIGVFVGGLADQVDELLLFLHEEPNLNSVGYDMELDHPKIRFVSMGLKTPAWDRLLFPQKHFLKIRDAVLTCDYLLLRGPSPLTPAFFNTFNDRVPCSFMLVGDYDEGVKNLDQPFFRKLAVVYLLKRNQRQLAAALQGNNIFVNSAAIRNKYENLAKRTVLINTSSITKNDFYFREDTCTGEEIKLVYTGRFDFAKGLVELLFAFNALRSEGLNLSLHLAGWEDYPHKPVQSKLIKIANEAGNAEFVTFYGKLGVGEELNSLYRSGDIYVLPSYYEGFPRTIWEAMANSLPVITCPVGGIPLVLTDETDVLFAEPKNTNDLQQKIKVLINDERLRKKLLVNAREKAQNVCIERQTEIIVNTLRHNFNQV